jgi:hypothetical protein
MRIHREGLDIGQEKGDLIRERSEIVAFTPVNPASIERY